jgi:hypothetical protein
VEEPDDCGNRCQRRWKMDDGEEGSFVVERDEEDKVVLRKMTWLSPMSNSGRAAALSIIVSVRQQGDFFR